MTVPSSVRPPFRSKDTFEAGQMDEFNIACKNLGALRQIRVISDGKSAKPSWHLDRVVIKAPTGEVYFFSYQDWISQQVMSVCGAGGCREAVGVRPFLPSPPPHDPIVLCPLVSPRLL